MQIHSVGIELGKTTFHLVALGAAGKVLVRKKFTQKQLLAFTANMQTSLIVLHTPMPIRSRLMGLLTVCIGMSPLGILLIGALADRFGPMIAVDIMAFTGLVAVSAIGLVWRQNDLRQSAARRSAQVAIED